jgi:hypothetical protein
MLWVEGAGLLVACHAGGQVVEVHQDQRAFAVLAGATQALKKAGIGRVGSDVHGMDLFEFELDHVGDGIDDQAHSAAAKVKHDGDGALVNRAGQAEAGSQVQYGDDFSTQAQ